MTAAVVVHPTQAEPGWGTRYLLWSYPGAQRRGTWGTRQGTWGTRQGTWGTRLGWGTRARPAALVVFEIGPGVEQRALHAAHPVGGLRAGLAAGGIAREFVAEGLHLGLEIV